jgi:antitoxin component of MazEF toxin-antitoxin module
MIECEITLRNWGNSLGAIIPKDKALKEGLHANQKVIVMVTPTKPITVGDLLGKAKFGTNIEKELKEIDKELESKFLK